MPGIITLNGDGTNQPAQLKEELVQKVHDRISIKGTYTRIWIAQKHVVTMKFTALTNTNYATLLSYCSGSAKQIHYINYDSGYNFIGYPSLAEDVYYQGASLLKDMTITITEI